MIIGDRLREIRQQKKLSQGEVEKRTGLLRCYISRVENGHTVPAIETLEKMARAFEVPMYQLFYEGEKPPEPAVVVKDKTHKKEWGSRGKDARFFRKLRGCLGKMDLRDRQLLLGFAYKVGQRHKKAL
jgi:transcriptional regulator with XRE-family HTH domain